MLDIRNQNPCSRISTSKIKTLDRVRQEICEEVRSKREYREQSTRHRRSIDSTNNNSNSNGTNNNNSSSGNSNSNSNRSYNSASTDHDDSNGLSDPSMIVNVPGNVPGNVPHNNITRKASEFRIWRSYTESNPTLLATENNDKKKTNNTNNRYNNRSMSNVTSNSNYNSKSNNDNSTLSSNAHVPSNLNINASRNIIDDNRNKSPSRNRKISQPVYSAKSCDPPEGNERINNDTAAVTAAISTGCTGEDSTIISSVSNDANTDVNTDLSTAAVPVVGSTSVSTTTTATVRTSAVTTVPTINGPRTTITAHTITSIARAVSATFRRPISTVRRPQSANATRTMNSVKRDEMNVPSTENVPVPSNLTGIFLDDTTPITEMGRLHCDNIRSRPNTPNGTRRNYLGRPASASCRVSSYSSLYSNSSSGPSSLGNTMNSWGSNAFPISYENGNNNIMNGDNNNNSNHINNNNISNNNNDNNNNDNNNNNSNGNSSNTITTTGTGTGTGTLGNGSAAIVVVGGGERGKGLERKDSNGVGVGVARRYHSFNDTDMEKSLSRSSIPEGIAYSDKQLQPTQQNVLINNPSQTSLANSPKVSYQQIDFSEISSTSNVIKQSKQLPSTFKQDSNSRLNSSKFLKDNIKKERDKDIDNSNYNNVNNNNNNNDNINSSNNNNTNSNDNNKIDNDIKSIDEGIIDNNLNNLIQNNIFPRDVSQQNNQVSLFLLKNSMNVQKLMSDQNINYNINNNSMSQSNLKNISEKSKELLFTSLTSNSSFNDLPSLTDNRECNSVTSILSKTSSLNSSQKISNLASLSSIPNFHLSEKSTSQLIKKTEMKLFNTTLKSKNDNDNNSANNNNINIDNKNRCEIDDNRNFHRIEDYEMYLNNQKIQKKSNMTTSTAENTKLKIRSAEDILNFRFDKHIVGAVPGGKIIFGSGRVQLPRRNSTNSLPSR